MNRSSISKLACSTLLAGALIGGAALPASATTGAPSPASKGAAATKTVAHKTVAHKTATKAVAKKVTHKKVTKKKVVKKVVVVKAAPAPAKANLTSFETALLADINQARSSVGEGPLVAAPGLTDVARRWSLTLVQNAGLSHNPDLANDAQASGSDAWTWLGENVGTGPADDEPDLFAAYMASPHHRDNILDPRGKFIGIGVIQTTDSNGDSVAYNTCDFSDAYSSTYGKDKTPALPSVMSVADLTSALS